MEKKVSLTLVCGIQIMVDILMPETQLGNYSVKSKQLHIVNTDKTRSKRTRSQFSFQTSLIMTPRRVFSCRIENANADQIRVSQEDRIFRGLL